MKFHLCLLFLAAQAVLGDQVRFYVGTYTDKSPSQGVYTGLLNTETGKLGPLELAVAAPSPNFLALAPGEKPLYAVVATNGGSIAAFRVQPSGKLDWLNSLPSGTGGCHVAVDAAGRTVVVTGADGFMGSHLTEALVELGADVHAFVRATSSGARSAFGVWKAFSSGRLEPVMAVDTTASAAASSQPCCSRSKPRIQK